MTRDHREKTALAAATLMMAIAIPAAAQETEAAGATDAANEDIIVTASRRPQTLQEVPISVGVVTGAAIEQQGQRLFTDLQSSVPNLQIDNTNGNYAITIRGLGSGANNLAFEQSVGLFVDGVYSSRARSLQVPFLDVERIEVVRGPQGALFGKNTNAGAISMVTRRPTRDFEAEFRAGTELAEGGMNFSGFLSGPISDTLSLRVSGGAGQADGYIENRLTGFDDNGSKYRSGRVQLLWEPSDDLEVLFKVEGFRNEINGSNAVYNNIGNATCSLCNVIRNASGGAAAQDMPGFWRYSRGFPKEYDVTKSRTGAMTVNWTPGEWTI
ncbi:MAG: TonB-dependent receptor, partial [Sphingopyxis sp.]